MKMELFLDKMQKPLQPIGNGFQTIFLGDFNFNLLESPSHKTLQVMDRFGFQQVNQSPSTDYGTLLDHVYVKNNHNVKVHIENVYFSDHDIVCIDYVYIYYLFLLSTM